MKILFIFTMTVFWVGDSTKALSCEKEEDYFDMSLEELMDINVDEEDYFDKNLNQLMNMSVDK